MREVKNFECWAMMTAIPEYKRDYDLVSTKEGPYVVTISLN